MCRDARFGAIIATGNAADLVDPDGDGNVNLLGYALGGNPLATDTSILPTISVTTNKLSLSFIRQRADVTYTVEASNDFVSWPATIPYIQPSVGPVTDNVHLSTQARRFLRLKVTAP